MTPSKQSFLKLANHPFKFRMYLFYKLPAAFFSGIKIRQAGEESCVTSVPYKWLTQNPFHSGYFASLAMAAELSTGMLALSNVYNRAPAISMLLTNMEAVYIKKVTGTTFFTCNEGREIALLIDEAVSTGAPQKIIVKSAGVNENGELVAEFLFTWSFKVKTK